MKLCPRCSETYDDAVDFCAKDGTRLIRGGESADLIGTVIAERYRIVSRLGEGGMGQVYLAEHVRMKRKSAIKIMRPALVHEVEALQRFTREAENASQLSHPNIAAIFDFGESAEGIVYLAMEYIDGHPLSSVLERDGAVHPEVAADIIGQAADGLQAAHDMDMLHRDIKPDNIMLGTRIDGTYLVKLVDFGIARTIGGGGDQRVTRTGYAVGTPQYMSPEQLAGDVLDGRSDQYALALSAFVALTGKSAFPAESTKESLIQRLTARPQSLQSAREDIDWPESLQAVFNRALAPEPSERYDSVIAFSRELSVAINSMTPTQTTELYRRALDVRAANVVSRTPSAASATLAAASGERAVVRASETDDVAVASAAQGSRDDVRGAMVGVASSDSTVAKASAPSPTSANGPRSRMPWMAGAAAVVVVAGAVWATQFRGVAIADSTSSLAIAGTPSDSAGGTVVSVDSGTPAPAARAAGVSPDTAQRRARAEAARLESAKQEATRALREKAVADSVAAVAAARARYPEAPARAMIDRGIDTKAHIVRSNDIRVVVMPTPMFMQRAEQAQAWKASHSRNDGGVFESVDPIEKWSAWNSLVSGRRAVYVLEVAPERAPWPSIEPEKLMDFKKGDVQSVEVLRDGVSIPMEFTTQMPAVVNGAQHEAGGRKVFQQVVGALPPTTFAPRDDGKLPRIELMVIDATRNGTQTRIQLSESLVRRLYNELAPWRDALVK